MLQLRIMKSDIRESAEIMDCFIYSDDRSTLEIFLIESILKKIMNLHQHLKTMGDTTEYFITFFSSSLYL